MDAKHFESHVPIETVTEGINSLMMSWPKMVPSTGKSGGYFIGGIGLLQKILFNQEPGMSSSPPSLFLKGDRFGLHCSHSWHLRTTKVNEENNKGFSRSSSPDLYITVDISLPCNSAPQENLVGSYNISSSEETEYCLI